MHSQLKGLYNSKMSTIITVSFGCQRIGNMPFNHHNRKLILLINYNFKGGKKRGKNKRKTIYGCNHGCYGCDVLLFRTLYGLHGPFVQFSKFIQQQAFAHKSEESTINQNSNAIIANEMRTLLREITKSIIAISIRCLYTKHHASIWAYERKFQSIICLVADNLKVRVVFKILPRMKPINIGNFQWVFVVCVSVSVKYEYECK